MKFLIVLSFFLFVSPAFTFAQDGGKISDYTRNSQNGALKDILDSTHYDEKNINMVQSNGESFTKSQREIDQAFERGTQYYREGNYEKAFPIVSELAIMGIKDTQMILGMMYLEGHHVQKSTVRGMAWLGVANEAKIKHSRKVFKHVYKQLSDEHKQVIDATVADYKSKYGVEAQNIDCKKQKAVGSNIETTECRKKANSESPWHPII